MDKSQGPSYDDGDKMDGQPKLVWAIWIGLNHKRDALFGMYPTNKCQGSRQSFSLCCYIL